MRKPHAYVQNCLTAVHAQTNPDNDDDDGETLGKSTRHGGQNGRRYSTARFHQNTKRVIISLIWGHDCHREASCEDSAHASRVLGPGGRKPAPCPVDILTLLEKKGALTGRPLLYFSSRTLSLLLTRRAFTRRRQAPGSLPRRCLFSAHSFAHPKSCYAGRRTQAYVCTSWHNISLMAFLIHFSSA